jgi:regulator of protease activity HflC (stomatin/prohibitin superfamily)
LSFVDLLAAVEPEAFQRVYERAIGDKQAGEGFAWASASKDYLDVERYSATIRELVYCRVVDRFLYYLYLIARCVYEVDSSLVPDVRVRISSVVAAGTVDELLRQRARIAATELSFDAPKMLRTVLDLAGVDAGLAADAISDLEPAIAARNVLVHHNGIANEKYVQFYPAHAVGDPIKVDDASLKSLMAIVHEVRADIDSAMQERHGVSAAGLGEWIQRSLKEAREPG